MKKISTLALAAVAVFCASAADFSVYQNGILNPELEYNHWWNASYVQDAANPTDPSAKVMSFKTTDGGTTGSCGIMLKGDNDAYTGPLNSATLHFSYYAEGTGDYAIRLTAVTTPATEQDYNLRVTAENAGKWIEVALPVQTVFPEVAAKWKDFGGDGKGFVFGLSMTELSQDAIIYFDNVYYSDIDTEWKAPEKVVYPAPASVPVPTTPAADVVSVFGSHYPQATGFWIGGWGQTTRVEDMTIDNNPVEYITHFNYLGWEFASHLDLTGCQYMHVDYYTPDGTTFGFTPIGNGENVYKVPEVKQEEWNSYDVKLTEFPNVDFKDVYQIKFDLGAGCEGYIANVYFYKKDGGDEPVPPVQVPEDGISYSGSVDATVSQTMNEETKEYPYTINYVITWNKDQTVTVKATYDWKDGEPVGVVAGSVFINNEINDFTLADGVRTVTTSKTYNANDLLTLNFYLPMALGVVEKSITYEVGSNNGGTNGVDAVEAAENVPVEYYNLQGARVSNPENGIYIRVQGNKVSKVVIR